MLHLIAMSSRLPSSVQMLIDEFKPYLNDNIIKQYLNGNPNDLGGCCAGPAGTVASNQGGERRGGWIKRGLHSTLKSYGLAKTVNPIYFLIAAAKDVDHYDHDICVKHNRSKFEQLAFKSMTGLSKHNPKKAFSSDWLYSICTNVGVEGVPIEVQYFQCLYPINCHTVQHNSENGTQCSSHTDKWTDGIHSTLSI